MQYYYTAPCEFAVVKITGSSVVRHAHKTFILNLTRGDLDLRIAKNTAKYEKRHKINFN